MQPHLKAWRGESLLKTAFSNSVTATPLMVACRGKRFPLPLTGLEGLNSFAWDQTLEFFYKVQTLGQLCVPKLVGPFMAASVGMFFVWGVGELGVHSFNPRP